MDTLLFWLAMVEVQESKRKHEDRVELTPGCYMKVAPVEPGCSMEDEENLEVAI